MGLTTRPSKNFDLAKIDEIQTEFFEDNSENKTKKPRTENKTESGSATENEVSAAAPSTEIGAKSLRKTAENNSGKSKIEKPKKELSKVSPKSSEAAAGNLKIADLLATEKTHGVRHTSRPYTVPRSLTIDLTRLKSKFRTRSLQYTQNELMDKMLGESLEEISSDNFLELREKAFGFVKSPEQCSRRSVTLREETVSEMNELKAALALKYNRRFSADEVFTTLLAVAFMPLYEKDLL